MSSTTARTSVCEPRTSRVGLLEHSLASDRPRGQVVSAILEFVEYLLDARDLSFGGLLVQPAQNAGSIPIGVLGTALVSISESAPIRRFGRRR